MGAIPTLGIALVPRAIARLAVTHPEVHIDLHEGSTPALVERVGAGTLDLAVVAERPAGREQDFGALRPERFIVDPMRVAVPASHRLAGRRRVGVGELRDEPWIVGRPTEDGEPIFETWPSLKSPRVAFAAHGWPARLGLVAAGLGIALIPGLAAPSVPSGVVVIDIDDPQHDARPERRDGHRRGRAAGRGGDGRGAAGRGRSLRHAPPNRSSGLPLLVRDVALERADDLVAVQLADVVGLLGDADEEAAAQGAEQADDVGGRGVGELEGVGDLARLDDDDVRDLEDRAEQRRAELVQPPGALAVGVAVDQAEGDRVVVAVLAGAPDAPEVRARDGALAGEGGGEVVVGAVVDDPDDDRRACRPRGSDDSEPRFHQRAH